MGAALSAHCSTDQLTVVRLCAVRLQLMEDGAIPPLPGSVD